MSVLNTCEYEKGSRLTIMSTFKAGAARVVITPPIGVPLAGYFAAEGRKETARDVHDDLFARAFVMNDGVRTIAIVTTDLIGLGDEELAAVREVVQRDADIKPEHLVLACTHTHSGPAVHPFPSTDLVPGQADEHYYHLLPRLIGSAVTMAVRRQRPARVGAGNGTCSININRREILSDGTLRGLPFLGKNSDGITDRNLAMLRVDDTENGNPMAVLLSYACHPVVLGPNLEISADYVGYAVNFIERSLGKETIALFANGAQGDMNSIVHPGTYADAQRLGRSLGAEALKVVQSTETHESVQIKTATRNTELPLNPDSTVCRMLMSNDWNLDGV
jgi:neutral ceramidase